MSTKTRDVAPRGRARGRVPPHAYSLSYNQAAILVCIAAADARREPTTMPAMLAELASLVTMPNQAYVMTMCKRLMQLGFVNFGTSPAPRCKGRPPKILTLTPDGAVALSRARDHLARIVREIDAIYPRT